MNSNISYTSHGRKYNQHDQELVHCAICNNLIIMIGTELCDRCYELDSRIRADLDIAERLVNYYRG